MVLFELHLYRSSKFILYLASSTDEIPLVFAFLKKKDTTSYRYVLQVIAEKAISLGKVFRPENFLCDHEKGFIKAVSEDFPDSNLCGCHFHYSQALFRRIQKFSFGGRLQKQPKFIKIFS